MEDNRKNWKPEETAVKAGKVYIVYEAFLSGKKNCLPMKRWSMNLIWMRRIG